MPGTGRRSTLMFLTCMWGRRPAPPSGHGLRLDRGSGSVFPDPTLPLAASSLSPCHRPHPTEVSPAGLRDVERAPGGAHGLSARSDVGPAL